MPEDTSTVESTFPHRTGSRRGSVLVSVLVIVVVLSYASAFRPMWFDEFVQFALAGMEPAEAMQAIIDTTGSGVNQGHTGVYLFLDYWLLQAFGANLLAFRLPSILSGAATLAAAVTFLRVKGFGPPWQALLVLGLAAQWSLMYYTGEARPYMPLVASSIATLAYYQYPRGKRRRPWVVALGLFAILGGAISHPYFGMIALVIFVFSAWERGVLREPWPHWVRFANPWLVVPGVVLYLGVGAATWAKARPDNYLEPWYWFGGPAEAWGWFVHTHTQAWQPVDLPWFAALSVLAGAGVVLTATVGIRVTAPPLTLIGLGFLSSALITYASIAGHYWVFARQWVAGLALVTIGWVWLLAASWQGLPERTKWPRFVILSLAAIVASAGFLQLVHQVSKNQFERGAWVDYLGTHGPQLPNDAYAPAEEWVKFANHNVWLGGPVWPEFAEYYVPWLPAN